MHDHHVSRRDLLKLAAAGLAASVVTRGAPHIARAAASDRPNILFLMSDQHRGDTMGCDGHPCVKTPTMDWLAREGARFRCAYSTTPTCTPARAALLTGLQPWRHGLLGYAKVGEKYPIEMPQALSDVGYHTIGIGKMHWHPQRNAHGFKQLILDESGRAESPEFRSDYRGWFNAEAPTKDCDATGLTFNDYRTKAFVHPERLHPTHWTAETAVRFLLDYNQPEPFFMKVSFARPHSPYDPPQRWLDAYQDADIPPAHVGAWADRYRPQSEGWPNIWHGDMGADQVRHSRQGYYGSVSFVDEQMGRIIETLEARGLLDNTLIVYTSDHGDMTGDHHLWRKSYAYEASAHIPMLMRWPKGIGPDQRGLVLEQPVELRDILPTFLHASGAPGRETLDGRSLLELVHGATNWRPWIDLEHDICYEPRLHWSGLTDGKRKYIFHTLDGEQQFFDLETDPGETKDLAGDPAFATEIKTWRSRLIEHLTERGEPFVKNGDLALRPESNIYSPNYPGCACHPNPGKKT